MEKYINIFLKYVTVSVAVSKATVYFLITNLIYFRVVCDRNPLYMQFSPCTTQVSEHLVNL